ECAPEPVDHPQVLVPGVAHDVERVAHATAFLEEDHEPERLALAVHLPGPLALAEAHLGNRRARDGLGRAAARAGEQGNAHDPVPHRAPHIDRREPRHEAECSNVARPFRGTRPPTIASFLASPGPAVGMRVVDAACGPWCRLEWRDSWTHTRSNATAMPGRSRRSVASGPQGTSGPVCACGKCSSRSRS